MSSDNDDSTGPALVKPSALKSRGGGVPLPGLKPGFQPPLAGLRPPIGLGAGVPAGLAEALAKKRQQQRQSEEENNNNDDDDGKDARETKKEESVGSSSTPPAGRTSPPPMNGLKGLQLPKRDSSGMKGEDKRESEKTERPVDSAEGEAAESVKSPTTTTKGKRISTIQVRLWIKFYFTI